MSEIMAFAIYVALVAMGCMVAFRGRSAAQVGVVLFFGSMSLVIGSVGYINGIRQGQAETFRTLAEPVGRLLGHSQDLLEEKRYDELHNLLVEVNANQRVLNPHYQGNAGLRELVDRRLATGDSPKPERSGGLGTGN